MPNDSSIHRRRFLWTTSAGTAVLWLGCGDERQRANLGDEKNGWKGGQGPTCGEVTEANIEGPFFQPDSPERTSLVESDSTGTPLLLTGHVLDEECSPLSEAVVDFWQADETGAYDNLGNRYRGHQRTDAEGRYALQTIVPGRYLNGDTYRPAHIHVKIAAPGFGLLTTQLYFPDDPFNTSDPFIRTSLLMDVQQDGQGGKDATFDFVLTRSLG